MTSCPTPPHPPPVSFRPFYLLREFGPITVILVYVPGPDFKIVGLENNREIQRGGFAVGSTCLYFNLGDFNSCDLQYITCPTRLNRTIDLCYGNTESAYRPVCRPPLGRSDHNVVHLLPKYKRSSISQSKYRQKVKTEGTQTKSRQL